MKQYPSNLKYKKYQKINYFYNKALELKKVNNVYGTYSLQCIKQGKMTYKQIESCRRTLKRNIRKIGIIYIKIFTGIPIYKKSLASRMGKGKGNLSTWISTLRKGTILFELSGINDIKIKNIINKSSSKLPIKVKLKKIIY